MPVFQIREANKSDASGMAKVRVDTWRATYKGIVPDEFLENLSCQQLSERWQKEYWENRAPGVAVFVAENERKEIIGFAFCGLEQSNDPVYRGEIQRLYVLPQYQNRGVGHELVTACVNHLDHELKVNTMLIWVFAENPNCKFYESLGGKIAREKTKEIGGRIISMVGYGWVDIRKTSRLLST